MSSLSTNIPICLFCNCPASCSLGQGELILLQSPSNSLQPIPQTITRNLEDIPTEKRNNFILETGKIIVPVDAELFNIGFSSSLDLPIDGNIWVHERCLRWSSTNSDRLNDYEFVRTLVSDALKQKCVICDRYGASMTCQNEACGSKFHLACAQSSGCFFSHTQSAFLCPQHLDSVVSMLGNKSAACEACSEPGDVRGQLFCTNCDKHYHAECLMLESNRVVRTGWRCPDCKVCQTCRQAGDDAEMIMCNVCDKGYHTFCLRNQSIPKNGWSCSSCLSLTTKINPVKLICSLCQNEISTKQNTRQCNSCQVQIHANCHSMVDDYYDDDSLYTCRSCSLSSVTEILRTDDVDDDEEPHKDVYRSSSNSKLSRILNRAQKSVNSPSASPSSGISTRKLRSIDYSQQSSLEYTPGGGDSSEMTTPATANTVHSEVPFLFESLASIKDESSEHSMDLPMAHSININIKSEEDEYQTPPIKSVRTAASQKAGKGKPFVENRTYGGEISKKRARRALNNGHRRASSPQSSSNPSQMTNSNAVKSGATTGTGLRGRPPKIRKEVPNQASNAEEASLMQINALNTSTGSTVGGYTVGAVKRDDDEHHAVTVLCASDELFTLGQDMCVGCGSFGRDEEGRLICCTQCGQSYHPFCAGLNKLSKVILKQGWRCLDCTVCEGCGKPTDESRLLLCDDCDISYHTYCLQPPLDQVPKGNWKCQWCVRCLKCGTTSPGPVGSCCLWENNYTECAPCHSLVACPVCTKPYRNDELIVQCTQCDRWLHGSCEHVLSEDSTLALSGDFVCSLCRPTNVVASITGETPAIVASPKLSSPPDQAPLLVVVANAVPSNLPAIPQPQLPTPKATKLDEGVYLTDTGVAQLKSIRVKPLPKKGPAAAAAMMTNSKSKRGGLNNSISGGIKRNNSNSVHDDDTTGNNTTGAGSGTSDDEGTKKSAATVPTTRASKGYTGIGGFQVKIRGQRRRQDASSTGDAGQEDLIHEETMGTNKRKRDRRPAKKKSVLEEHMPPEMQEAFFGSELAEKSRMMAQHHAPMTPLPLNEQTTLPVNNPNNEYTIKLDHDSLNRLFMKKTAKLAQAVKEEQKQAPVTPLPPPAATVAPEDENEMQDILDNEDFCKFVDYVMNDSKAATDSMLPILDGPTDIEDFLDFIDHPEPNNDLASFSAEDLLVNPNTPNQNQVTNNSNPTVQIVQSHQTTMIGSSTSTHHSLVNQGPLQTATSNLVVMANNFPDNSKQIIKDLAREMMESTGLHKANTPPILSQPTMNNINMFVKQESVTQSTNLENAGNQLRFHELTHIQTQMAVTQQQSQTWPPQSQTMIRIPSISSGPIISPANLTPNPDRSGGTGGAEQNNLIERTREDELLGPNATMSNVLYCNVNHPDLKQQFPDFNERFKQMKKIWRKVPPDAKQNYTQRARLNRTKKRAMKGASGQSSGTGRSAKRKNSTKQQSSEPEDNNNDGGGGSESRSSTPSSSTTNEPTNVVSHPNEQHQEHPPSHLYQQSRPMYSPSGGLMVTTSTNPPNFHHQSYQNQQRPQQQGYGAPVPTPGGYAPPQRFSFPPQQHMLPNTPQPQQSQNSPYLEYPPSTPRSVVHQSSSAESTPIHHSLNPNSTNQIRKSNSSSDGNTPYRHVSPMDEQPNYYQPQSPYTNQGQIKVQSAQQQLLPRGMAPRTPQLMPRFSGQDGTNFVRTPSSTGAPGQQARFIFTSPSNQSPQQQQQQQSHYVQYTPTGQGQHAVVVQQGTNEGFQRMPESPVHQHLSQQPVHHQPPPQFSPHHHPMTPNSQPHPILMSQQQQPVQHHHMSPYSSQQQQQQQQPTMHQLHSQHSPTIVVQPTPPQFSPSSVHHHQLTLNTNSGHQSPTNDLGKRQIQMQKPAQQVLVQHESVSYDEQSSKAESHDDSLNESTNSGKIRTDPLQSVPAHVLEQIDEVINDVVLGAGVIPQDHPLTTHTTSIPISLVPIAQTKIPTQHLITGHHGYIQQQSQSTTEWSNYQQQPTMNIAAVRGPAPYNQYHPQQVHQQHHDLLPATTNVINTPAVPQHEQQQIVAERISSILASTPHDQQQQQQQPQTTTVMSQAPIQIKRTWTMNPHPNNDNHFLASSTNDPSISLEDLLERDFKDKQQQQQSSTSVTDWSTDRHPKPTNNAAIQQTPLTLAHAVHLLQQAITHPLYQQCPPPELSGLINVGRDNDVTTMNASYNEDQFERYARWLKQRREINSLRIKADETNLADIKKKRNILLKKQKQSQCTPEEEQEMPRLSQQQTDYSRTLTSMRKERKQFDELEQAFLVYKQSRLNALYPQKSSPNNIEQPSTEAIVRMITMNHVPTTSINTVQQTMTEQPTTMIHLSSLTTQDEHDDSIQEDRSTLSPTISTEYQQKSENLTMDSTLPSQNSSSSFLTPIPVSSSSNADSFTGPVDSSQTNTHANEDTDNATFLPCRTSPAADHDQESIIISSSAVETNSQSIRMDQFEQ